ncbi:MAG: SGNH/GDSL hydrolase family protein [Chitinophagaceae bacterium]
MKLISLSTWLLAMLLIVSSCKKEHPPVNPGFGKADFSRYIAVGNSITAGYSSGGLYLEGQKVAYPNIIAAQMKTIGGGSFISPFFSLDQSNGSGYLRLAGFNADGSPNIVPVTDKLAIRGQANIPGFGPVTLYTKYSGNIENYGVPGLRLEQITFAPYGNLNGYFERLLPGDAGTNNTTYLDFVTAKPFTFFSCWLGNNDVLGYASSGGIDSLTNKAVFKDLYNLALSTLTKSGGKGIVVTIPDVTAFAFFNTVTVKALLDAAKKANPAFNAIYISAFNPKTGTYTPRVATESDLIVLRFNTGSLGSVVNGLPGYGLTPLNPLANKEVLDAEEVALAQEYVKYFNLVIKSFAKSYNLAVFDSYDFLNRLKAGMIINGVAVNSTFITGGAFSLDGVHLTPRGNAVTANECIKAINSKFGSKIPQVDVSTYKGVL